MTHVPAAERGTIHLLDERGEVLEPRVSSVYGKNPRPAARMKAGSGIAGQAIAERRTIYVPDTQADPRFVSTAPSSAVRSLISAPLVVEAAALGVISISSPRGGAFDPDAQELLSALAAQAAVAVKNARLYEDLKRTTDELERWSQELEIRVEERTRELQAAQADLLEAQRRGTIADLGARMAHELRHPLAVLANAIFLLRSHTPAREKAPLRYLEIMERQVERSDRIVNSLLAFAERRRPTLSAVSMAAVVTATLDEQALPVQVELTVDPLDGLPSVMAEPEELRFILGQIIANALEAMPGGGRLSIQGEETQVSVRLTIEDSGSGIAPEALERVFEPLFSTKPFGLGLGLSVAHNLTERMGGRLELSSRPGEGTRVWLTLPVASKSSG